MITVTVARTLFWLLKIDLNSKCVNISYYQYLLTAFSAFQWLKNDINIY